MHTHENSSELSQGIDDCYEKIVVENQAEISSDSHIPTEITAMRYFVGYVASKVVNKLNCEKCEIEWRKEDEVLTCESEIFIFEKNYSKDSDFGNLYAPSDDFFYVCRTHVCIFRQIFDFDKSLKNIKQVMVSKCLTEKSSKNIAWFDQEHSCYSHAVKAIHSF